MYSLLFTWTNWTKCHPRIQTFLLLPGVLNNALRHAGHAAVPAPQKMRNASIAAIYKRKSILRHQKRLPPVCCGLLQHTVYFRRTSVPPTCFHMPDIDKKKHYSSIKSLPCHFSPYQKPSVTKCVCGNTLMSLLTLRTVSYLGGESSRCR